MRVLVTSSRNPFALDIVRKLAATGHQVVASDTFAGAIGSHSKYLLGHAVTASPTTDTEQFICDINRIVERWSIDLILPTFEEAFYLAARRQDLPQGVTLYTGDFGQLSRLHDKETFQAIAAAAKVPAPETVLATDHEQLVQAADTFGDYFARAAFSRGGVALLTNTGPIAGQVKMQDVQPTPQQPWLVQPFVSGPMVCTYSTLINGRVTAHCTYRAPEQWKSSTGIAFESVDSSVTLGYAQAIADQLPGYTGQLSFDFVDHGGQLLAIECNPRTTNGVLLMTAEQFSAGISDPGSGPSVVPAGEQTEISAAVLAECFDEPLRQLPGSLHELFSVKDVDAGWHDAGAMLWAPAALVHGLRLSRGKHEKALEALGGDIVWDGQDIPGMSAQEQAELTAVHEQRG